MKQLSHINCKDWFNLNPRSLSWTIDKNLLIYDNNKQSVLSCFKVNVIKMYLIAQHWLDSLNNEYDYFWLKMTLRMYIDEHFKL